MDNIIIEEIILEGCYKGYLTLQEIYTLLSKASIGCNELKDKLEININKYLDKVENSEIDIIKLKESISAFLESETSNSIKVRLFL